MTEPEPTDPVIGGGAAMLDSIEEFLMGFADLSMDVKRSLNTRISRSSSRSSMNYNSGSQSRTGSPTAAARTKLLSDDDSSLKPSAETSSISTKGSTSVPLAGDVATSLPSDGLTEASTQLETQTVDSTTKNTRTRKHARTINDIRDLDIDGILCAGKSAAKVVNVGLRAPASFTMAVAKGFHNMPLLYGDDTVREQSKVTGIKSGLKAAGKVG